MDGRIAWMLPLIACLAFAGCTPPKDKLPPLPLPITQDEQVQRLATWSKSLEQVRANTVGLGVELKFRNEKKEMQQQNAEGTLLLRQHPDTPARRGDVLLLGKAFDQPVFEAGRNDTTWWFLIRLDTKTAWVGDASRPVDPASLGGGEGISSSILRADLVVDLLALSPLPGTPAASRDLQQAMFMRVNDAAGTNELLIIQPGPGGKPFLAREIIVDRRTDQVREVRLNGPDGKLVVRSELWDYKPVTFAEGVEEKKPAPAFPRQVRLSFPGQEMTIKLQFESVQIPKPLQDRAFATPDFAKEQLNVIKAD